MRSLSIKGNPTCPDEHGVLFTMAALHVPVIEQVRRDLQNRLHAFRSYALHRFVSMFIIGCAGTFFALAAYGQVHFTDCVTRTGNDATLIIPVSAAISIGGSGIAAGDELAVITDTGQCAGAGTWTGDNLAFPIWGDNSMTPHPDGLAQNEPLYFRIWDASADVEYNITNSTIEVVFDAQHSYATSDAKYIPNAIYIVKVLSVLSTAATH